MAQSRVIVISALKKKVLGCYCVPSVSAFLQIVISVSQLCPDTFKVAAKEMLLEAVTSRDKSLLLKAHIAFVSATMFCSLSFHFHAGCR